jgi:hypothetical protein
MATALGAEPRYTNLNAHTSFAETLDYVFHSGALVPHSVLDVYPWPTALQPTVPKLPTAFVPSDHIPVVSSFVLRRGHVAGGGGAGAGGAMK